MKGKFKLLGHIGLALFLVSTLVLMVMPVAQAATAVTEVSVDFPYEDAKNTYSSTSNTYIVHFKPTTALVRGVDYVTVTFPDGSETMGGDGTIGGDYAFTISSTAPSASTVDFSTNYDTSVIGGAVWTDCTSTPTVGGNRIMVRTPIDVAAGTDVWVRFVCGSAITAAATEASLYKVYVSTTKDTTPVLSTTFALGNSTCNAGDTSVDTGYPLPATAGSTATYVIKFSPTTDLTASSTKVTVKFPLQATVPSSLAITDVSFSTDGSAFTNTPEAPTVNVYTREVTAITSLSLTANAGTTFFYMKIGGITNPTIADSSNYLYMVRTSVDGKWECSDADPITAGSITKVIVANGEIGTPDSIYSDDATMVDMYSSQIYIALADQYGNAKAPDSEVTVSLLSSSGGAFYWCDGQTSMSTTVTSCTTVSVGLADPATASDGDQIVYYLDDTPGTHTLTFSATNYEDAEWTFTVVPGVSVYDSSNNLVSTYKPASSAPTAETGDSDPYTQKYSGDYIRSALDGAMSGDTVKLGDGIYEIDNDSYLDLDEKITLTSVSGASSTTIRNTQEINFAIQVETTGTATYPITISGLTFQRLRAGGSHDIDCAIRNTQGDYVTVQNCVFNYIMPDQGSAVEAVIWFQAGSRAITSATISNNTFNNCCGFNAISGTKSGSIVFDNGGSSYNMTGVTVSGNTLTDCNDYGIAMGSGSHTNKATISDNTITNGYSAIDLADNIELVSVTGNTITNPYNYGIYLEGSNNDSVTIKNNTITGCAGTQGAIRIPDENTADVVTIQYNDITGTSSAAYAIYAAASPTGGHNCKYNYFGDASGPYYSALVGATVSKSNPNGTGDKITDKVCYYPWLHKSKAYVVADNASYQACTIKLNVGWNTLSAPVKLIDSANSIDELIPSGMSIGYWYDAFDADSDGAYWEQITTGYTLSPCDAVYVKMDAVTYVLFKFDASSFSTPSKALATGWNLVGLASLDSSMEADDAVASVYETAGDLPGYSQVVSPSLNAAQYDMYYAAGATWSISCAQHGSDLTTELMRPGLGYWIYMLNDATLAGFEITPIVPDLD